VNGGFCRPPATEAPNETVCGIRAGDKRLRRSMTAKRLRLA